MNKENNDERRVSSPSISGLRRRPLMPRASQPSIMSTKPELVRTASLPVIRNILGTVDTNIWGPSEDKENLGPNSVAGLIERFEILKASNHQAKKPEITFTSSKPEMLIPPNASAFQINNKLKSIEEVNKTLAANYQCLEDQQSSDKEAVRSVTERKAGLNESLIDSTKVTATTSRAPVERSHVLAPSGVEEALTFIVREDDAPRVKVAIKTPSAPVASKSRRDSLLELKYDKEQQSKSEEEASQKKHKQHWIKFYHPYLEESVRYQVGLEQNWPKTTPESTCMRGMRMMLIDWLAMVQTFLRQRDVVLQVSVRLLDRVMVAMKIRTKDLQLVAITTFWIAAKIELQHELTAPRLLTLCKNSYSNRQLCRAEAQILRILNFRVPHDTPLSLVAYQVSVLELCNEKASEVRHVANFLLDVSLLSWEVSWAPPSKLASAATCCALTLLSHNLAPNHNGDILWDVLANTNPAFHPRSSLAEVIAGQLRLLSAVQDPASKFKGLRDKYRASRHLRIASWSIMSEENICNAIKVLLPGQSSKHLQ